MQGWIKLHRSIMNHWLYQSKEPFTRREAWIDILLEVNHTDQKVCIDNTILECKCGESLNSLDTWARRWNWNKSKVRRFLKLLESDSMCVARSVKKTTHLTVCNYETYQVERNASETQVTHKRNASETQVTPNKNEKNEKNEKKELMFEDFWIAYGRKGNKKTAKQRFMKLSMDQIEDIRRNLPAYLFKTKDNLQYRKDAQVYLNPQKEYWNDIVFIEQPSQSDAY